MVHLVLICSVPLLEHHLLQLKSHVHEDLHLVTIRAYLYAARNAYPTSRRDGNMCCMGRYYILHFSVHVRTRVLLLAGLGTGEGPVHCKQNVSVNHCNEFTAKIPQGFGMSMLASTYSQIFLWLLYPSESSGICRFPRGRGLRYWVSLLLDGSSASSQSFDFMHSSCSPHTPTTILGIAPLLRTGRPLR